MYADGSSSNVVSSAAYYQVPYPFNLKIKSRPDVAVEENKVGTVTLEQPSLFIVKIQWMGRILF
ncbi:hypothetical protein BMT17_29015 [Bacillus thuringiensis serovar kurstaki]|nr:hypothetical protein BMT17_29015 [Bacillus thuringiensis serovar kurstaki]